MRVLKSAHRVSARKQTAAVIAPMTVSETESAIATSVRRLAAKRAVRQMKFAAMMVCAPKLADAPTIMTATPACVTTVPAEMQPTVKALRNVWAIECASPVFAVHRVVRQGA